MAFMGGLNVIIPDNAWSAMNTEEKLDWLLHVAIESRTLYAEIEFLAKGDLTREEEIRYSGKTMQGFDMVIANMRAMDLLRQRCTSPGCQGRPPHH
jgi:hypothetical protein